MSYTTLILKRIYKNKLNIIPLVLISVVMIVMYVAENNHTWQYLDDPYFSGMESIEQLQEQITSFQEAIIDEQPSSQKQEQAKQMIAPMEQELTFLQNRLSAAKQKDWIAYYTNDIEFQKLSKKRMLEDAKRYGWNELETIRPIDRAIAYDEHMITYDLGYDGISPSSQGFSFINYVYRFLMPLILSVLLVFLASRVFCFSYIENMNLETILPINIIKKQGSRLLASLIIGVSIVLFYTLLTIVCGTIGNEMGSLSSPVGMYSTLGEDHYVTLLSILPQLMLLCILSICFITNVVALISSCIHKTMACLLVSIIIIMGGLLILPELAPLHEYLHFFPTTYLNFFNVITGEVAFSINNTAVNVMNGTITLTIGNIVLMLCYYMLERVKAKGVKSS